MRGHVQGVGYRWFTRNAAEKSGVGGWVRNRADGTVEAELHGTDAAVDAVLTVMSRGPAGARVNDVNTTEVDEAAADTFEIK